MFIIDNDRFQGMATHSPPSGDDGTGDVTLPSVVPFELPHVSRLSWELGSRVVEGDHSTPISEWDHTGRPWTLSVFRVTSATCLVRLRTPVGRERFYGTAEIDLESVRPALDDAPSWHRRE